ncbi:MAG: tetratricopeptide repeat protein [Phycisphaera sp.]|nr:tetratricopeptide repeat protein [Phycisphaera sp.]
MPTLHRITALLFSALLVGLCVQPCAAQNDNAAYQSFVFAYRLLQRGQDKAAAEAFDDYLGKFPSEPRRGDALYYRAMLARQAGEPTKAVKMLDGAPPPTLVPAHAVPILLGQSYLDLHDNKKALAALEKVRIDSLEPAVAASVHYLRGVAYRGADNLPAAAEQLKQVVSIDSPMKPMAMLDLARVQALQGQNEQATKTLEDAIDLKDPAVTPEAARLAGDIHAKAGRQELALEAYRKVLTGYQSSTQFAPSVVGTLWSLYQLKRYDELLKTYETYRDSLSGPDLGTAQYLAGSAYQDKSQHEQAIPLLTEASDTLKSSGGDKALYKLAVSLLETGQYERMNQTLDRLVRDNPKSSLAGDAVFLRASADMRRGDPAAGAARLTQVVQLGKDHPLYARALLQRAALFESSNQPDAAVTDYRAYLDTPEAQQNPDSRCSATLRVSDLLTGLGLAKQSEQTLANLLAGQKLDPLNEQEAIYRMMLAQVAQKKNKEALATVKTLLEKHPQNRYLDRATYYRGLLLLSLGRPDEALPDLMTAGNRETLDKSLRVNALRLSALTLRQANRDDDSAVTLAALEKLTGLDGLSVDEQLWLGGRLSRLGQPREALRYLQPVLKLDPRKLDGAQRARAYYAAGVCLRSLGQLDAAMTAFNQAVALGYGLEKKARLEIARVYADKGHPDDALAEYEGLTASQDGSTAAAALLESARLYRVKSRGYADRGLTDRATDADEQAYKLLLKLTVLYGYPDLSPTAEAGYMELVDVASALNKGDECVAALKDLSKRFPETPYDLYARGELARREGKPADAKFLLRKARESAGPSILPELAQRIDAALRGLEGTP